MKPKEVKKHFKTGYRFAKETGMSANTLQNWINAGYVPFRSQKKIELLTENKLVAVWDEKESY